MRSKEFAKMIEEKTGLKLSYHAQNNRCSWTIHNLKKLENLFDTHFSKTGFDSSLTLNGKNLKKEQLIEILCRICHFDFSDNEKVFITKEEFVILYNNVINLKDLNGK